MRNDAYSASRMPAPESILIVKPSSLGDVVHTLPAVARIKRHWPQAHLSWLINPEWAPLLEGNPHVDKVILFPRQKFRGLRGIFRTVPWARELRARVQADLALDLQGLLRSGIISKLCRKPGGRILGLSDAREGARYFYDEIADVVGRDHAVDRYLALVERLGIHVDEPLEWPMPRGTAVQGVKPGYVLLHPFSRGSGKSMTVDDVVEFCREVAPHSVVVAGKAEEHLPAIPNAVSLLNQTSLAELIWLIRNAGFVVSVDSGPMHIAAAITDRLLSIHTWSDPRKVGPYRQGALVWKDGRLATVAEWRAGRFQREATGISQLAKWLKDHLG
jgi:ADP-heptose:LPS heptosyltransferase